MSPADAARALRPSARVLIIAAAGLGIVALAVLAAGDGRCFTAPPESVAEQFVRKLSIRRWGPARSHLTPELAAAMSEPALKAAAEALERRWGGIEEVEGRPGPISGDAAWATAQVKTSRHEQVSLTLPLVKRKGVWRVAGLGDLTGG